MLVNIFKFILCCFTALALSACTGSAYQLPKVTSEEMALVESEISADTSELKTYKRSDGHYKKRIASITRRLKRNAQPLCDLAELVPCKFEVTYSNEDIVNAYAYEGYKITVFKGLLKFLKNDDEMAAVIAHEMGHHLAKHNEETLRNAQTGAAISGVLTAVLLGAASANNPYYNNNAYQQQQNQKTIEDMIKFGAKMGELSYSKVQEREADLLAAYLLEYAGYDLRKAQNLMYVFSKISGDEVEGKAALLKTHPPTPQRVVSWKKAVDEIDQNDTKLPYPISRK